jgi:uncharacterized protein YrrD
VHVEDIGIGYEVYCGDDHVGTVARLIADASDAHVTDIVVDRGLLHGAKIVPLEDLVAVEGQRVRLKLTREQFAAADGFADVRFQQPEDDWSTPPGYYPQDFLLETAADLGAQAGYGINTKLGPFPPSPADPRPNLLRPTVKDGTPVLDVDGEKVGEVHEASFHPEDGRLDRLVLKHGPLGLEHSEIPLDWVEGLDGDGVVLRVPAAQVAALPKHAAGSARADLPG